MRLPVFRSAIALSAFVLWASLAAAQPSAIIYEIDGRFSAASTTDVLGLSGSTFRFTLSIDPSSPPLRTETATHRAAALYASQSSSLEVHGAPGSAFAGVHRSAAATLEVIDIYAGDFCMAFGSRFETRGGMIPATTVCFASASLHGTSIPSTGLDEASSITFQPVLIRGQLYAIDSASIRVAGGAR